MGGNSRVPPLFLESPQEPFPNLCILRCYSELHLRPSVSSFVHLRLKIMAYRKISMNKKTKGRKSNRPGPTAKAIAAQYKKAAATLQRLFRGHLGRRRASANRAHRSVIRGALRKGVNPNGTVMRKIRKRAYQGQWKAHRNRYSMRLRNRGSRGPIGRSWY